MVQPYRRTLGVESSMTTRANTSQLPLILAVLTILGGFGGSVWGGAVWLNGKFAEEDSKITAATGDHDKRMTDMQRQIDALSAQIKAINIVQPAQTQELVRDLMAKKTAQPEFSHGFEQKYSADSPAAEVYAVHKPEVQAVK
jgi:hypothetical protein